MDIMWALNNDPLFATLHQLMDADEPAAPASTTPSGAYARDRKAMARTPADIKELPNAYVFEVDMPGVNCSELKVTVEDDRVLVISGERRREEEKAEEKEKSEEKEKGEQKDGAKYLKLERRMGKFMRKFPLPENANVDAITAGCKDGVLTVTVGKVPPPQPKKPKTIEVQCA